MSNEYHTPKFNTCVGPSMFPTLRSGDSYVLKKYDSILNLKAGDVIVYAHPYEAMDVVHRIIKIKGEKIITRGDNNNKVDEYIISYKNVKGYVETVYRNDKQIRLARGKLGLIRHKLMLIRKYLRPVVAKPIISLTDKIAFSRILFFMHGFFDVKVIIIERGNDIHEILKYKNKAIGKRKNKEPWKIRFPYKMFIDTDKL